MRLGVVEDLDFYINRHFHDKYGTDDHRTWFVEAVGLQIAKVHLQDPDFGFGVCLDV